MALKNIVEKGILWALRSLNDEAHCYVSTPMVAKFIKWQNLINMYRYNRTQDLLILTILAVACRDHEMNQFCSLLSIKYYTSKWLKLNSSVSKNKLKMLRCWHTRGSWATSLTWETVPGNLVTWAKVKLSLYQHFGSEKNPKRLLCLNFKK